MPPTWKDKGGRLTAFARGHSHGGANHHAPAPKSDLVAEKPSETPQDPSHGSSRQELAEAARLVVPPGLPNGTASHYHPHNNGHTAGQAHLRSPPRITQTPPKLGRARGNSEDCLDRLFSGSQLGESFMNSGLSTPQNEVEEGEDEATPNARRESKPAHQTLLKHVDRAFPSGHAATFSVDDNLRMSVVSGAERRAVPQMMDGFYDDAIPAIYMPHGDHHSSLQAVLQSKLPMREVRVKRLPAPSQSTVHAKREVSNPSPSVESARWQGQRKRDEPRQTTPPVLDLDEDVESLDGYEEHRRTLESHKSRDATGRPVGASYVRANVALQKLPKERKRRRGSVDYDDKMLSLMTYKDLRDEPFDLDPGKATGPNGQDGSAKLPLKLEQYQQQGQKEQIHMFASMSFDDWEASGDWFVEQFADIMKRLRDARRSKRRTIQAFEDGAAKREEAVRLRSETIDRKLMKMRQDGQRVVEDKSL